MPGAGKSTIIKMLISLQAQEPVSEEEPLFRSPVVGSVKNDNSPTSGDVQLYIDPGTAYTSLPLMYADCEELDGGAVPPWAYEFKDTGQNQGRGRRQRFKSSPEKSCTQYIIARWGIGNRPFKSYTLGSSIPFLLSLFLFFEILGKTYYYRVSTLSWTDL